MAKKIDLDTQSTQHGGLRGLFELLLRRFRVGMHLATMIPVYAFFCAVLGLALVPAVAVFRALSGLVTDSSWWLQNGVYGLGLAAAYCTYGVTLIFIIPTINFIVRGNLKPWRGPYYSAETFKWFLHNALTYIARFTFLEFVTPSPLSLLFYRMMGMKMGPGVVINTTWISDPSLITLGKKVTLGGSVTLVAHYGQGGLLVISPVVIGEGCTIGLKATVMGGVTIGDGAKVLPHSVVMPKTQIPAGETWGGVPARKIETSSGPAVN